MAKQKSGTFQDALAAADRLVQFRYISATHDTRKRTRHRNRFRLPYDFARKGMVGIIVDRDRDTARLWAMTALTLGLTCVGHNRKDHVAGNRPENVNHYSWDE